GTTIDIHTGGMDHIPVHHNNEIAQTESITHKPLARFWMHEAFVTLSDEKISKSLGNDIYLSDITERGYHPLALRYFYLQAHYRTPMSFTWEALAASDEALKRLWKLSRETKEAARGREVPSDASRRILALLRDDLATPQALALLWETVKDDDIDSQAAWGAIVTADRVLGLSLVEPPRAASAAPLPEDIRKLAAERDAARQAKDFARSDDLRIHIESRGYRVDDTPGGTVVTLRSG
ncbi:MAG TPA: class I tRNA ligase family protein, partial [Candidatus Paceibacterota bacterium]|nr:class I tRNA ligase family protein [Candidatus Paceibacterota bacterium]